MNVNEQITFHSVKSAPLTKNSKFNNGVDETLVNSKSTEGKNNLYSKKGVLGIVKAFSGYRKVLSIALLMLFSLITYAQKNLLNEKEAGYKQFNDHQIFDQLSGAAQNLLLSKFGKPNLGENIEDIAPTSFGSPFPNPSGFVIPSNVIVNNPVGEGPPNGFTQSETAIVLGSGTNVIAGFNDSGSFLAGSRFTGYSTSANSGANWTDQGILPANTNGDAGDPVLARDNTLGRTYLVTLNFTGSGNRIFRSDDDMATVLAPVEAFPGFGGGDFIDKPWMAVDNFAGAGQGNIYVTATNFAGGGPGSQPGGIYLFRSTDNGATFAPAGGTIAASLIVANCAQGSNVVVGPDHSVFVFWWDCNSIHSQRIRVRRSTNQGLTFGGATVVTNLLTTGINGSLGLPFRSNAFPQGAVNPVSGDLYVSFNDNPAGVDRGNIYFTQSCDNGATWSVPIQVNGDLTTNDQEFPAIAVSPDGLHLALAWYDNRSDPANALIERWAATACISGCVVAFDPNILISTAPFPVVVGVDGIVNPTYMGDYDQMAADNSFFYTTWGDNRSGDPDVWFAKESFSSCALAVDISCPSQANLLGCSTDDIDFGGTLGTFSSVPKSITEAEFITLGGTITPGTPPYDISYQDVANFSCPIIVTRTFTITDDALTTDNCNQIITVDDTTFPTIDCSDIDIFLGSGECEAQVFWTIDADDDCTDDPTLMQIGGLPNGSIFDKDFSPYTITYKATDDCNNMTTCSFDINIIENVPDGSELSCHGLIHSTLNENCQITVTPGMILTGDDYGCYDDYNVMVKPCKTCPPIPGSPIIDGSYIGDTLVVEVCDSLGDYCCWGYIVPEDKKKPTICCVDFSMNCNDDTHPDSISDITKTYPFPGLPTAIPGSTPNADSNVVVIELEIDECDSLKITDFNVYLNISHGELGDLSATVIHPNGTTSALLFDQPGTGICGSGTIVATFDDDPPANSHAAFEAACPIMAGTYKTTSLSLNNFNTFNAFTPGTYKIRVEDHNPTNPGVNGVILGAAIEIGGDYSHPVAVDNCDDNLPPPTYTDTLLYTNCDSVCYQKIKRTWCVTDASNNTFCCDQFICLERPDFEDLVCPPDYDGTCPDDPLESLWLQDILAGCADNSCGAEVQSCTYQGEPVVVVTLNPIPHCSDPYYSVYKCSGEHIFDYGGVFAINWDLAADLVGCTVIYNCGDFLPHPTKTSVLSCTDTFPTDANGHPDPIYTGKPKLDGADVNGFCMFYCIYEDDVIPVCEGSYIIVREWECWDWCTGEDTTCTQIIKVMDNDPPEIECPPDTIIHAGNNCVASTILPPLDITDVCSDTGNGYSAYIFSGGGNLIDSSGNWVLSDVPIGTTTICYAAFDGCGNKDTCYFDVNVIDVTPPVAKCKPWRSISISTDSSYCSANLFDDGSYDECSSVTLMVKRFTNPNCTPPDGQETDYGPEVYFYCCDVGDTIAVELKVTDAAGLMNFCTSYMIVEDNLPPMHNYCPPDTILACGIDIDDFINTGGEPDFTDNCGIDTIIITNDSMFTGCGGGMVFRKWVAIDVYGNKDSCEQKITLGDSDPFTILDTECWSHVSSVPTDGVEWPCDVTLFSCSAGLHPDSFENNLNVHPNDVRPRLFPDSCNIGMVYSEFEDSDDISDPNECLRFIRTWSVYDSCSVDPTIPVATYDQEIRILGSASPVIITVCEAPVPSSIFPDSTFLMFKATDDCTPDDELIYSFFVDLNDDMAPLIDEMGDTCDASAVYPIGVHRIYWEATDECGQSVGCDYLFEVKSMSPPTFNVSGGIENEEGDDVEHVAVEVESDNMQDVAMTGDDGAFGFNLPSIENYVITPERDDNILNGVSTYDLVLISKHILQFEPLSSPYKIIAADVNHSGTVSTIDMVELRKVILFINDEFPNNTSWRFVDAEFAFPDPANPFSTPFPEVYTINGLTEDEVADFVGVKIGDVNCSASPNDLMSGDDRNADDELVFTLANQSLTAGETYQFDFEATDFDQVQGFQFTMNFNENAIEFNEVEAGDLANISDASFGLHKLNEGIITASWNASGESQSLENGKVLFSFSFIALEDGQLSDLININSRFTKAEAYNHKGLLDLSLQFAGESGTIAAEQFELYQNQPNPFKDETVIGFYLPESGKATFKVFDISGRVIKSVEGDYSKGYNEISINRSELQSSGVLYYQLESAEHIGSKKMVLLD